MPFDTSPAASMLITPANAANLHCPRILGRGRVADLAWSADGRILFAATPGGLWCYLPDRPTAAPEHWTEQPVTSLATAPDGSLLALADPQAGIEIWHLPERQIQQILPVPDHIVRQLCFSPDGRWLIASGRPVDGDYEAAGLLLGWDCTTWEPIPTPTVDGAVSDLAFHPDSQQFAYGQLAGTTAIWDLQTQQHRAEIEVTTSGAWAVHLCWWKTALLISVATDYDSQVQVWDPAAGTLVSLLKSGPTTWWWPRQLGEHPVVLTNTPDSVGLWSPAHPQTRRILSGTQGHLKSPVVRPDGQALAAADDEAILVWEPATPRPRARFAGHTAGIDVLAFSPDGQLLAVADHYSGLLRLWEEPADRAQLLAWPRGFVPWDLSFSRRAPFLVAGGAGPRAVVVGLRPLQIQQILRLGTRDHGSLRLAAQPDGRVLAFSTAPGLAPPGVWDPVAGSRLDQLTLEEFVPTLYYSSDGRWAAGSDKQGRLWIWDAARGRVQTVLDGINAHLGGPGALAFRPDRPALLVSGAGGVIRGWDLQAAQETPSFAAPRDPVLAAEEGPIQQGISALLCSPDGQTLVAQRWIRRECGPHRWRPETRVLELWDMASGQRRVRLACGDTPLGFNPAGTLLVSAPLYSSETGFIQLWAVKDGSLAGRIRGQVRHPAALAFNPAGTVLAVGDLDGRVYFWTGAASNGVEANL